MSQERLKNYTAEHVPRIRLDNQTVVKVENVEKNGMLFSFEVTVTAEGETFNKSFKLIDYATSGVPFPTSEEAKSAMRLALQEAENRATNYIPF